MRIHRGSACRRGSDDCYCALTAVKAGYDKFSYYQDIVFGIQPPLAETVVPINIAAMAVTSLHILIFHGEKDIDITISGIVHEGCSIHRPVLYRKSRLIILDL